MQNSVLTDLQAQLTVGGKYATDTKGKDIYQGMQTSFYALWDSEIKAGKTPAQLADPESKDYIGNAFMSLKRSPAQAMSDVVNQKPGAEGGTDWLTQLDNAQKQKNAPVVTTKEGFDKLKAGAYYMRDGTLYQKPSGE